MDNAVKQVFDAYPASIQNELKQLRSLIFDIAKKSEVLDLEETIKWNQPSYLCERGTTIRFGWSAAEETKFFIYFNCKSRMVETIKALYGDLFCYQGNRALIFDIGDSVPHDQLKNCFYLALHYHKVKHLPLLGA